MPKPMREVQLKAAETRWVLKITERVREVMEKYPPPINLAIASAMTAYAGYRLERLRQNRIMRKLRRRGCLS